MQLVRDLSSKTGDAFGGGFTDVSARFDTNVWVGPWPFLPFHHFPLFSDALLWVSYKILGNCGALFSETD